MKDWLQSVLLCMGLILVSASPSVALDCVKREEAQLAFMLSPLADKKIGLPEKELNIAKGEKYTEVELMWAFGLPDKIESKPYESQRDGKYVVRTWYFKGLTIAANLHEQYYVSEVRINSPEIGLKCGLRIGRPPSEFVSYLGEAEEDGPGILKFDLEIPGFHPKYHRWMSAQIWLTVRDGRVESLRWEPGPGH